MIGSSAWTVVAAALCLGTGVTCLALAATGVGDRAAQLTHAVMGVAMAGMFSPWGDPVPGWIGALLFTVVGAWFVAAALRRTGIGRAARHLAISSVAMVLMYLMHHHPDGMPGAAGSGAHAGHAMAGGGPRASSSCRWPWCWRATSSGTRGRAWSGPVTGRHLHARHGTGRRADGRPEHR